MKNQCFCGTELPTVPDDETPYQFCSLECKLVDTLKRIHKATDGLDSIPMQSTKYIKDAVNEVLKDIKKAKGEE